VRIPAEQRRAALARAALAVIARDGVAAATTRAIVAEAGMSLASFHYAYRSRLDLLRDVVQLVVDDERDATVALLDVEGASFAELVRRGLGAYAELLVRHPGHEQAMLELTHLALREPELDGVAQDQYARYRDLVGTVLTAAADQSGMRWTVPVDILARLVVAFTDGLTVAWLVDRDDSVIAPQLDLMAATLLAQAEPAPATPTPAPTPARSAS
jgi:AcrR family transcriptional regulator